MALKKSRVSSARTGEAVDKEDVDEKGDWFVNASTPMAPKSRKVRNEREDFIVAGVSLF